MSEKFRCRHTHVPLLLNYDHMTLAKPKVFEKCGHHIAIGQYADPFAEADCSSLESACVLQGMRCPPDRVSGSKHLYMENSSLANLQL